MSRALVMSDYADPDTEIERLTEERDGAARALAMGVVVKDAEIDRLRERQSKLEAVLEVVQSEHYQVGAPGVPRERGGCICEADDCPELEALAALGGA